MSAEFSANISMLRKEKNISQRDAADALGISQALLSHYENGIRECSLDFVKRAAEYYGVSADYLLGLSDSKNAVSELLSDVDIPSDSSVNSQTLLRCIRFLGEAAEKNGEVSQIFFDDYFSLCVKKYLSLLRPEKKAAERLCSLVLDMIADENGNQNRHSQEETDIPLSQKTVEQHSDMLISKKTEQLM